MYIYAFTSTYTCVDVYIFLYMYIQVSKGKMDSGKLVVTVPSTCPAPRRHAPQSDCRPTARPTCCAAAQLDPNQHGCAWERAVSAGGPRGLALQIMGVVCVKGPSSQKYREMLLRSNSRYF